MKTKVVAFRLTEREYDAVLLAATKRGHKIGDYVREALVLNYLLNQLEMEEKRLATKAKRAANKAAKEAAANGTA